MAKRMLTFRAACQKAADMRKQGPITDNMLRREGVAQRDLAKVIRYAEAQFVNVVHKAWPVPSYDKR